VLPQPGHDADHRVARLERHSVLRPPFPEGKEHAGATICYANNTKTSKARWRSASLSGEFPTALWRVPEGAAHLPGLHPKSHAPLAFQTREHGVPGMDSLKHLRVTGMNQRPAEARMEVTVGLCEIRCEPRLQSPRERDDVVAPGVLEQVFQHHLYRLVPCPDVDRFPEARWTGIVQVPSQHLPGSVPHKRLVQRSLASGRDQKPQKPPQRAHVVLRSEGRPTRRLRQAGEERLDVQILAGQRCHRVPERPPGHRRHTGLTTDAVPRRVPLPILRSPNWAGRRRRAQWMLWSNAVAPPRLSHSLRDRQFASSAIDTSCGPDMNVFIRWTAAIVD